MSSDPARERLRELLEHLFPPELVRAAFNGDEAAMQKLEATARHRAAELRSHPREAYRCNNCSEAIDRPGICPWCRKESRR